MSHTTTDIERLVREVIAELGAAQKAEEVASDEKNVAGKTTDVVGAGGARDRSPAALTPAISQRERGQNSNSPSPVPRSAPPGELVIDARVVTKNEIFGRLDGVRHVIVAQGAIVTPAVRDELIRRGIAIQCAQPHGQPAVVRLALVISGTDFDPEPLAAGLARDGLAKVECSTLDCLIAATDRLAAEVSHPDTLGALLTRHAAAGLCLANRLPGVRAVSGLDAPAVAAAATAVGANLLVVDPRAGTFFQLKQMVAEFCRGGIRPCPEVFKAKLA